MVAGLKEEVADFKEEVTTVAANIVTAFAPPPAAPEPMVVTTPPCSAMDVGIFDDAHSRSGQTTGRGGHTGWVVKDPENNIVCTHVHKHVRTYAFVYMRMSICVHVSKGNCSMESGG